MTVSDGVGRPRVPEVVARDERILAAVNAHVEDGVRVTDLATELDIRQALVVHALNRLRREGLVVRRDGYRWWPLS